MTGKLNTDGSTQKKMNRCCGICLGKAVDFVMSCLDFDYYESNTENQVSTMIEIDTENVSKSDSSDEYTTPRMDRYKDVMLTPRETKNELE